MTWYVRAIPYDPDYPETGQAYLVTTFEGDVLDDAVTDLADDLEDELYLPDFEEEASISISAIPDAGSPPADRGDFFAAVRDQVERALRERGYRVTGLPET